MEGSGRRRKAARISCAPGVSEVASWAACGLAGRQPALQDGMVAPGGALVGRHHQQLAEAAGGRVGGQAALSPALGAEVADGQERLAQQGFGEAGAQRGEQRGPGRLLRVGGGQAVRADLAALLVAPAGLAVERAEGDGQHGALGQRLPPRVADDGPARRVERDLARARLGPLR